MSEIPKQYIENYANLLDRGEKTLIKKLRGAFQRIDFSDVAKAREALIEIMNLLLVGAEETSAILAAEFYDFLRKEAGEKSYYTAILSTTIDFDAIESDVRFLMGYAVDALSNSDPDKDSDALLTAAKAKILSECERQISYTVKKAAGDTVLENVRLDPAKPRFARVPAGHDSCEFCIMLSSQGFVYRTAETAGLHKHYHPNCRCQIVPGFKGQDGVRGYDPDALYEQYQENEQARIEKGLETMSAKGSRLQRERRGKKR